MAGIDLTVHAAYRHYCRRAGALAFDPGIASAGDFLGHCTRHISRGQVFAGSPQPVDPVDFFVEVFVRQ